MQPAARSPLDEPAALALLSGGELAVDGRLIDASNATLLCTVTGADGSTGRCVYKPVRGERPLWDFPDGTLAGRELAAYLVSEATGWSIVPPTVLRDGPFGPGMVQWWVEVDTGVDLGALVRADLPQLRRMSLFDAVANNADRKGGHLLPVPGGHVFGCDHGLTFHAEPKLRTVLWGWRSLPFDAAEHAVLDRLAAELSPGAPLRDALRPHLSAREVAATAGRVARLRKAGVFPEPTGEWPPIPWPPF